MNTNNLKLCAWAGPIFCLLMVVGYLLTSSVSLAPINPLASAETVAQLYQENSMSIRAGLIIMVFGAAFYAPFAAVTTVLMSRMGNKNPVLIITFAFVAAALTVGLYVILVPFGAASYRVDGPAEITRAFHDYTFLFLLWPGTLMPVMYMALGLAVLGDSREIKIFPRWFAFYSFWSALLALTGCFIVFFKSGPFALNGLFAFWVNLSVFFAWFVMVSVLQIQSVSRELIAERKQLGAISNAPQGVLA
ncbi:hypothetical protein RGQ13_09335 [Thalassotalea psychrophila]|uniref:DUF998 domain-containing protein n=1 Tax=Thalassotalea psychrophila TaxID=3065647 RepID=A0ABY9TZ53_9GAMM|nr:hypothetical protein RGQ13_09335 [Colwelliaceae bacterium SQ149]